MLTHLASRFSSGRGRAARAVRSTVAMAAAVIVLVGCHDLLKATAPDRIIAGTLDQPTVAPLLVASAVADFGCAFEQYVLVTAQLTDELQNGNLSTQENIDLDKRNLSPGRTLYAVNPCASLDGIYTPLSTARWDADNILKKLDGYTDAQVPNRTALIATAAAYAGYGLLLMGEGFCTSAIDAGPELTPQQLFALAEARFTRAIAAAGTAGTGSAAILNMAYVGRARSRLDMAHTADAVADAQLVPKGFSIVAPTNSASLRAENYLYRQIVLNASVSVDVPYRNLTFGGVPDPRVPVANTPGQTANDHLTPLWTTSKYGSLSAPLRIASYVEAQLIIAEVQGGQTAVGVINALHSAAGLPPFASTDPAAIAAQVQEERRREFFLEGQHLGDIRRLGLTLTPPTGTPYFNTVKGGTYGSGACFPLPDIERNSNPTLKKP